MRMATPVLLLGMLWAGAALGTVNAAAAKNSEDFFFRQLRSPFERKLKGTRRGCSAYGHSCFGGYGKRGAAVLVPLPLPLVPPLPLPLPQLRERDRELDGGQDRLKDATEDKLPSKTLAMTSLDVDSDPSDEARVLSRRSPLHDDNPTFVVLRQPPVSSRTLRTPLWGRSSSSRSTLHGQARDAGLTLGLERGAEEDAGPYQSSRLFLRRWLTNYRRLADDIAF